LDGGASNRIGEAPGSKVESVRCLSRCLIDYTPGFIGNDIGRLRLK